MRADTLYVRDACGEFIPAKPEVVLARAKEHLKRRVRRGTPLTSPQVVRDFLAVTLGDRDCEYFCVICLDGHHRSRQRPSPGGCEAGPGVPGGLCPAGP